MDETPPQIVRIKFDERSLKRLETCHRDLQLVMSNALQLRSIQVRTGFRSRREQNIAVNAGKSKTRWPRSKHNRKPSHAVDILPYPFKTEMWKQMSVWRDLASVVLMEAARLDIKMRWGGDWDNDGDMSDERFIDCPHFELVGY